MHMHPPSLVTLALAHTSSYVDSSPPPAAFQAFMMMQQSRRQHGSSGELDVFGATGYFAGLPDRRLIVVHAKAPDHEQQLGGLLHDDDERHAQAQLGGVAVAKQPSGKSKLAALLSFMVSPSSTPRASFRKEPPPSPLPANNPPRAGDDEPGTKDSSSSSSRNSSMRLMMQGCVGVHELDLGVATGDRRLQGVRVVKGGGDEERWVVRCSAWDEEDPRGSGSMLDADESSDPKDDAEEGDDGGWESDSSSDLFDLNLLSTHADLHLN